MARHPDSMINTHRPIFYQQIFREYLGPLLPEWSPIFTDGSKSEDYISFAAVTSSGETIAAGHLLPFSSVYTAEAAHFAPR